MRTSEPIRAPEPETTRAPEPERASRPRPPSVPSRPVSGRNGLPFTLEPSEASLSGASLSRAVDGLRAVVAARQRAAETPARPAGAHQPAFDEDLVAIPDVPVVMPTGDEWPQRVRAARVSVGRAWRPLTLLPLIAVALFFLFRGDGGTEPLAPDGFHPPAGPPDAGSTASAARAEFERRRVSLSESLASYNDRRAQLDLGTADCATLATVSRTAQHDFVRLSDLMAREETRLAASEREAWRHLVAETAAMAEHFRSTGCEPGTGGP